MRKSEKLYLKACAAYYTLGGEPIMEDWEFDALQKELAEESDDWTPEFKRRAFPKDYDPKWTSIHGALKTYAHAADWNFK